MARRRRHGPDGGVQQQPVEPAVRFRDDDPADLTRACTAVTVWPDQNPAGTGDELVAAIGRQFHLDYSVVLRAVLFAVDRHRARQVTGIATGLPVSRGRT